MKILDATFVDLAGPDRTGDGARPFEPKARVSRGRHAVLIAAAVFATVVAAGQPLGDFTLLNQLEPEDIADNGLVAGRKGAIGFTMRNGVVTEFIAAPVQGKASAFSQIYGVNNLGEFVGEYFAVGVNPTGYLSRNGALTTIAFPDAAANRTIPQDINNRGDIAGFYSTAAPFFTVGFLKQGNSYTKIEIPGARFVTILGMNDLNQLVGHYTLDGDPDFVRHGILWSGGQITPIEFPGAEQTEPAGIGEDGTIVGSYTKLVNGTKKIFGFVRSPAGVFSTIGIPGVLQNRAKGINRRGDIAGEFFSLEFSSTGSVIETSSVGWIRAQ